MDAAARRLRVLGGHIESDRQIELTTRPCSGNENSSSSYASATGQPSTYARVHGEVSRAPARWRSISRVAKEQLEDVKYEKAEGEGIAKVRVLF